MRSLVAACAAVSLATFVPVSIADENTWQPISGAETLRDLISGLRVEIDLRPGVQAIGEYSQDGTGTVEAWGETWPRTWDVVDDTTVCFVFLDVDERNCYTFAQNTAMPDEYRTTHTETGETVLFRRIAKDPPTVSRDDLPSEEGGPGAPSASEVALRFADPNASLGAMNLNFDYVAFNGDLPDAGNQSALRASFQPSLPYALDPATNLVLRGLFPVVFSQDVPVAAGRYESKGIALGDTSFDATIARSFAQWGGLVLGAGVAGTLPTATDDALGLDQWLLGPEALVSIVRPWGSLGLQVAHQWDVAGDDDFDTSVTGGQYFYAFNLSNGWQINGSPLYSYNHEAANDNAWTLPLAVGVSKTAFLNGRPWKFSVQYWHYIESPAAFGPDWQIRFIMAPVVALPW